MTARTDRRCLCGAQVDGVSMQEVLDRVSDAVRCRRQLYISMVNVAKVVNMRRDPLLRESVMSGDLVLADGMPLVWLSRFRRRPLPERIAGVDLMYSLFELADRHAMRVYLLGATSQTLERVAAIARQRYPNMTITGCRDGYFNHTEEREVALAVRDSRCDILFVAISSPKKELFMRRWGAVMAVPVCHGVGGSFDVMAGRTRRAPHWLQCIGLEWLYRLAQEPRRMWKRYLITNITFFGLVPFCFFCRQANPASRGCPWALGDDSRLPAHTSSRSRGGAVEQCGDGAEPCVAPVRAPVEPEG